MNYLVIDGEWTIRNWKKGQGGDPFDPQNKLCLVGLHWWSEATTYSRLTLKIEYDNDPFGDSLRILQEQINKADVLVLFNAKRDLHWLRRYGIYFQNKRIWDIQLSSFIMGSQMESYPSLNSVSAAFGLGQKDDTIEKEYWNKHIDTDEIPLDVLNKYLNVDLNLSVECFNRQQQSISAQQRNLVQLACEDLLILEEMEWNGIIYDVEQSTHNAVGLRTEIANLDKQLSILVDKEFLNWNSDSHISAVLYGGSIVDRYRVADGTFKSGKREGQVKFRWEEKEHRFERLVNPMEGSEVDREGCWSVAEPMLRQLKCYGKAKIIVELLLKRAKLEKLVSSYFEGIPKLLSSMGWGNTIHGTLNQCVAITGRISSSKPNLQNNSKEVEKLFRSKYEN